MKTTRHPHPKTVIRIGLGLGLGACAHPPPLVEDEGSGGAGPESTVVGTAPMPDQETPFAPEPKPGATPGGGVGDSPPSSAPGAPPGALPGEPQGAPHDPEAAPAVGIPCEIQDVLSAACGECHGTEPRFGAPMALDTPDDFVLWGSYVIDRINHAQRPMPPPPNARLSAGDLATLTSWIQSGAPSGAACGDAAPPDSAPEMIPEMPAPEEDCEHLFEITAHGQSVPNDPTPYSVPRENDIYTCFAMEVPWAGMAQALSFHPIVDDDRVLHHWLLYAGPRGEHRSGEVFRCNGTHPGMALVAGWAPGGIPAVMPDGVGLEMPPGPDGLFILEVHYHNNNGLDAGDTSGVRICATETLRPNTAALHWLGEERGPAGILPFSVPTGRSEIDGMCTPRLSQPVNILSSSPHMHKRGTRMRSIIHRASGGTDVLIDEPFDFNNQIIYQTPNTLYPGDRIETVCTFDNPGAAAHFGTSTDDEMCYNFVTAWPVGQIETGNSYVGANHACLQ